MKKIYEISNLKYFRKFSGAAVFVFSLLGAFLILNFTYKKYNNEFFRIEKFAVKEEWDSLLKYADKHPSMINDSKAQ